MGAQSFEHANVLSEKINFSALGGPGVAIFGPDDMAQKYGSTVKNLTLGFSPKLSGGVPIYVRKPEKNFGPKSQC